ncbi:MAG: 3-deoxy-D-manno-octulosonic acid transferase [Bacteroidetes bacterium]|nr:MAG: 3-deoxy-D-manno-octulosonic acid transferase [Bacteroidota bacterium]
MTIWETIYNAVIVPLGWMMFQILGLFKKKVRRGIEGREFLFERLESAIHKLKPDSKRVWFHSSSMGEFEQAKPIIAELKKRFPEIQVIVSFFSPSGYNPSRTYKLADVITYLPFDSKENAERFIRVVKPTAAVMVRYDVWPNHLWALKREGVPVFIANATFNDTWLKRAPVIHGFFHDVYNSIEHILTVSEHDKQGFETFGIHAPTIEAIGDTRFDQVWQRRADSKTRHLLPAQVVEGKKVFVVGSSWEQDDEVLIPAIIEFARINLDFLVILVPHEPDEHTLERIEYYLNGQIRNIRFSLMADYNGEQVILVDSVGSLMALYQYGQVAYVGGSFAQGIHNVLEPAVYGVPLLIGPKHENSQEAIELVKQGGAFIITKPDEALAYLEEFFSGESHRLTAGQVCAEFVKRNIGATGRFLARLEKVL